MSDKFEALRFEFDAACEKAWQDEKTGKMYVRAVASDDGLDLQRDRMGQKALVKMAEFAKTGVPFLETHRSTFEFGKTVDGEIVTSTDKNGKKVNKFYTTIELDGEFPQARKLFKEVAAGNCKRQLSIGGKLNLKNKDAVAVEMTPSGLARTINDIDLDHIAATREKQAANPRTNFVEAIAKSLDAAEADGWTWPEVSKSIEVKDVNEEDVKAGAGVLAFLGRLFKGGGKMNKVGTPAAEETATELETTPRTPTSEPEKAEATPKTPMTSGSDPVSTPAPKTEPEAKLSSKKAEATEANDLVNDIAILLSKRAQGKSKGTDDATFNALWSVRHLLAKEGGEGAVPVAGQGLHSPRDLSAAPAGVQDDKAKGDAAMAATAVTDHKRNIEAKGEMVSTAPTAKSALAHTMEDLARASKLPSVTETGTWQRLSKSLGEDGSEVMKALIDEMVEKTIEVQKSMMLAAVEKLAEDHEQGIVEVRKSVEQVGDLVNDATEKLVTLEGRIVRVEKAGGVSHSGPRGPVDATVRTPATSERKGLWGGLFGKAASEALSKY